MSEAPAQITQLLVAWGGGDQAALDQLMPLVYDELRRLARRHLGRERRGHTLQSAALVNEAYLKLVDQRAVQWESRAQFFALAAQAMRRLLVDHARGRQYQKRGGGLQVTLDEALMISDERTADVLALDDATNACARPCAIWGARRRNA